MSQSTIFQSCRDGAIASWVIYQYFRGVKCLAQGHNTAEVGLEPRTSRSGVRHSTTEPPRSLQHMFLWRTIENFSWIITKYPLISSTGAQKCPCTAKIKSSHWLKTPALDKMINSVADWLGEVLHLYWQYLRLVLPVYFLDLCDFYPTAYLRHMLCSSPAGQCLQLWCRDTE